VSLWQLSLAVLYACSPTQGFAGRRRAFGRAQVILQLVHREGAEEVDILIN
jgi:hypothetical protein